MAEGHHVLPGEVSPLPPSGWKLLVGDEKRFCLKSSGPQLFMPVGVTAMLERMGHLADDPSLPGQKLWVSRPERGSRPEAALKRDEEDVWADAECSNTKQYMLSSHGVSTGHLWS